MKTLIETLLQQALDALPEELLPRDARGVSIEVENTRDPQHGDFASNLAMRLGRATRQNPRLIAAALIAALPQSESIAKVEMAGAGFINFFLKDDAYHREIGKVLQQGASYGRSNAGAGRRIQVEFVSANPTGPLHVAHGRHAAFGASLSNLLEAVGYKVQREYYINDAGRQMDILAVSAWLRYLERCGEKFIFPANAYVGDYLAAVGEQLFARFGTGLKHSAAEVGEIFERAGLPFAPINRPEDLFDDPHLAATGGLADVRLPDGQHAGQSVNATLFPITLAGQRLGVRLDPPRMGEHTRELLRGLGYDAAQIDTLIAQNAVA